MARTNMTERQRTNADFANNTQWLSLLTPAGQARARQNADQIVGALEALGVLLFKGRQMAASLVLSALSGEQVAPEQMPIELLLNPKQKAERSTPQSPQKWVDAATRAPQQIRRQQLMTGCAEWLVARSDLGQTHKGKLFDDAKKIFGVALTTRIFNEAFKAVFKRPRGRPRKNQR
jgi:hypothetical protein